MIGLAFTLSGMLIFMLAVLVADCYIYLTEQLRAFDEVLGHDTKIFPDYDLCP